MTSFSLGLLAVGLIAIAAMRFAFPLPPKEAQLVPHAIGIAENTSLGSMVSARMRENPGKTGVIPLIDGRDAFAARVLLARAAEVSIDAQYYIWQTDTTGWILLEELRKAAERGVRVRLLVDDNGIPSMDQELAALDALPNAEVRIFNPFTLRKPKLASYLFDFPRLNHRMHNKSMTVDGAISIIGGRNIGDIYFAYGDQPHYFDLDVLAAGAAALEVGADFEGYWDSLPVFPATAILPPASEDGLRSLAAAAQTARASLMGSD